MKTKYYVVHFDGYVKADPTEFDTETEAALQATILAQKNTNVVFFTAKTLETFKVVLSPVQCSKTEDK